MTMKHSLVRMACVVAVLAGMTGIASAQGKSGCPSVAGEWAYTKTGTLPPPTGPVPYAAVGKLEIRRDGTSSGVQVSDTGGMAVKNALDGTGIVEADCSVIATVGVYDESGSVLLRTATMWLVLDDNGREARGIVTKIELPNGVVVPSVLTMSLRKVENNRGKGQ
jgi:hypothetical protein